MFVLTGFVFRCDFGRKNKARRVNFMMGRVWVIGRADVLGARTPVISSGFYHTANRLPSRALNAPAGVQVSSRGQAAGRAPRSLNRARAGNCHPSSKSSKSVHAPGAVFILLSP